VLVLVLVTVSGDGPKRSCTGSLCVKIRKDGILAAGQSLVLHV
jgi:hypothetical protein